jgi:hypothetical protein
MLILISDAAYDAVMARAQEVAAEQWRRLVFDTAMKPEAAEAARERAIQAMAEQYIDNLADRIAGELRP